MYTKVGPKLLFSNIMNAVYILDQAFNVQHPPSLLKNWFQSEPLGYIFLALCYRIKMEPVFACWVINIAIEVAGRVLSYTNHSVEVWSDNELIVPKHSVLNPLATENKIFLGL